MDNHEVRENLSNEELAQIRISQLNNFAEMLETQSSKIENLEHLLFITSTLYGATTTERFYFPTETKRIAKALASAMSNLKCENALDRRAKFVIEQAISELKSSHKISGELYTVLNSTRLEYLHKD